MPQPHECQQLLDVLAEVHALALEREQCQTSAIEQVAPRHQESARNLVHYVALRSFDLRPLQQRLSALGLSSLGRSEVSVLPSIRAVEQNLARWLPEPESFSSAHELKSELHRESFMRNTLALLGPPQTKRETRILVTAPRAAADDPTFVAELLSAGTDLLRINCAHDDADAWRKMVENVRQAEWETNRRCRILCDLAGPKLRTGPLAKEQGKKHVLSEGEQLWLTRKPLPGKSANKDPAHISCTLPEVLDQVH